MKNQTLIPVLLPAEDSSHLFISSTGQLLFDKTSKVSKDNKHLYLTSDALIKEGDRYIHYNTKTKEYSVFKAADKFNEGNNPNIIDKRNFVYEYWNKKIEFTTDPKLIADGVPAIDGNTKAIIRTLNSSPSSYTTDGNAVIGYTDNEVNFLTEFCKRYNQKDNQKVDVEKWFKNMGVSNPDKNFRAGFKEGHNQALQSQAGGLNLPSNDELMEMAKSRGLTEKEADVWVDGARSVKGMIYEREEAGIFSLEDMRKAFSEGVVHGCNPDSESNEDGTEFDKFIQSLTKETPKGDIVIECEMEYVSNGVFEMNKPTVDKRIKLKDGQSILVFK